jgi:hypothetical protein
VGIDRITKIAFIEAVSPSDGFEIREETNESRLVAGNLRGGNGEKKLAATVGVKEYPRAGMSLCLGE